MTMNQLKRVLSNTQPMSDEHKKFQTSVTSIEDFSNELFYEIFDYLDGYEIFYAFEKLNQRFENLLNDHSLFLRIQISSQTIFEQPWQHLLIPQRHRIISLSFADESILDRFIHHCTIDSSFRNLRSLNLNSLPAYKCLALLFDLISLPRLSSLICTLTSCFVDVSYIYRVVFRFQYLTFFKLSLPMIEDLEDFEQAIFVVERQRISSIEHLIIDHCCTLEDFLSILSFMPQLKYLTCQTLFQIEQNFHQHEHIILTNLIHLNLHRCNLKFERLENLFEQLGEHLQILQIIHRDHDQTYLDAFHWERLIMFYLPNLKRFSLKYYERLNEHCTITSTHRTLDRFSSTFWIHRQWIMNIELQTSYLIYSIEPYKKSWSDQTTTLDIKYRCTTVWPECLNEYFTSIYSIIKITYLDIDCSKIPLLICLKLIGLLPELQTLEISSLSLSEAKRLSAEKWKTLHAITYQNKIHRILLNNITDFGEIQFLTILCPSIEYLHISPINEILLEHLIPFIQIKQTNNQLINLTTITFDVKYSTEQIIDEFNQLLRWKYHFHDYSIQRIANRIILNWNVYTTKTSPFESM